MSDHLDLVRNAVTELELATAHGHAALFDAMISARQVGYTMAEIATSANMDRVTLYRRIDGYREAWQMLHERGDSIDAIAGHAGVSVATVNEVLYPPRR